MNEFPTTNEEVAQLQSLNPESWMTSYLKLNPKYTYWGPGQDFMPIKGERATSTRISSWSEFTCKLDDYNECVNFYFSIDRASTECSYCFRSGYNPVTRKLFNEFYDNDHWSMDTTERRWCDKITQDEVDALVANGRFGKRVPTVTEVNDANRGLGSGSLRHDGINQYILVETRARRLGVYGLCEGCEGKAYVYTEQEAHLSLTLWMIHPRVSASAGIKVERLNRVDAASAIAWLRIAASRNADRFAAIVDNS